MASRLSSSNLRQFDSDASRQTSVVVVTLETGEVYIISSLSTRRDTRVVYIDPTTGSLCHFGKPGQDVFSSREEAFDYITNGSRQCKSTTTGRAIIGYSVLGSTGLLLVATKLNPTVPDLPGGGCVYTVAESQWIKLQLQNPQPQGKSEAKNILELAELDIDGKYYFCETRDLTRPFPSKFTLRDPDFEFVWNAWFSKPFKDIGLEEHCVILLQGFAESRNFEGSNSNAGTVALIARRSKLHPGTRYLARGLNACSGTGNEVECEQIVWTPKRTDQPVPFSTYVWRRGTIPISWGAEVKIATEAEIYVSEDPYRGSAQYYARLSNRYAVKDPELSASKQKKAPIVPIVCVNLLRSGEGKSEKILVEHFNESIKYIRATKKISSSTFIQMINYDWHYLVKINGQQATISGLWKLLKAPTLAIGFNEGVYFPSRDQLKRRSKGLIISNGSIQGLFCMNALQNGVIRFNCADSLDRTNAASFFGAVQVFVEQCTRLGISMDRDTFLGYGYSAGNDNEAPLPPGWEERFDSVTGKPFYVDHVNKTTTWVRPSKDRPDKPWKKFDMSFDQFKSSTTLGPVNYLADLFLLAGDIHATIYTGSKAMHSEILSIFTEDVGSGGSRFSKLSAAQANVKISLQRRYTNYLVDSSRQKQLEMFLGLRLFKHLPSMPIYPLKVLSRPTGCVLKPVPSIIPIQDAGSSLLSYKKKELVWVCPEDADVVEVFIFLAEPCHISHLLLTISHGGEDLSCPAAVDVRIGPHLDGLKLVLENATIPKCADGTNLLIPLTGEVEPEDLAVTGKSTRLNATERTHLPLLYDFEEVEGELSFMSRIVALTFYPSDAGLSITLGEVEVLGVSLPWMSVFSNSKINADFLKIFQENPNVSKKLSRKLIPDNNGQSEKETTTGSSLGKLSASAFDFLTGDFDMPSQPVDASTKGSTDVNTGVGIDFLDTSNDEVNPFAASSTAATSESVVGFEDDFNPFAASKSHDVFDDDFNPFASSSEVSGNKPKENDDFNPFATSSAASTDKPRKNEKIDPEYVDSEATTYETSKADQAYDNTKSYLDLYRYFSEANRGRGLSFEQSMKLEIQRLKSNLSSAKRDRALLSISVDPATIDPNRILDYSTLVSVCNYADTLALLGQTYLEDRENASLGLEVGQSGPVDFWNVRESDDACLSDDCEIKAHKHDVTSSDGTSFDCSQCERNTCRGCCAGKGAFLLLSDSYKDMKMYTGSSSGSNHGSRSQIEGCGYFALTDGVVCKRCCKEVLLRALYVDYVRVLGSMRRKRRADSAAANAVNHVCGGEIAAWGQLESIELGKKQLKKLLNGAESLAEFPHAGLLYEVETADVSAPLLSLIAPGFGEGQSYWRAPANVSSVEFALVLGRISDVSGVAIVVSSCGYSAFNCPVVEIWASNKISREERSFIGKWDVKSLIQASYPELFGPEEPSNSNNVPRNIKFPFPNPIRCRIIWIKMSLSQLDSSSSDLHRDFDLLSFESSFTEAKPSHGIETDRKSSFIHAKRIIVYGKSLRPEIGQDASLPELLRMKSFINRSPQFSRFRISAEERTRDNDLVLEQLLSPGGPSIAGFRFDYFNVVRPRVSHSPSVNGDLCESHLTCLEDRVITPAVLYIQVFALQEPRNLVNIGEFRLPETKVGTALYFDFSELIQARVMIFRLSGDVTAFVDDISEIEGSGFRNLPLATGLSLANKIKLYYYADPYEVGKMAGLSAV